MLAVRKHKSANIYVNASYNVKENVMLKTRLYTLLRDPLKKK